MSHSLTVTGILLIFASQEIVKQYFVLKQLYEIMPWLGTFVKYPSIYRCSLKHFLKLSTIGWFQNQHYSKWVLNIT